jgi:hypothetical protein
MEAKLESGETPDSISRIPLRFIRATNDELKDSDLSCIFCSFFGYAFSLQTGALVSALLRHLLNRKAAAFICGSGNEKGAPFSRRPSSGSS